MNILYAYACYSGETVGKMPRLSIALFRLAPRYIFFPFLFEFIYYTRVAAMRSPLLRFLEAVAANCFVT